MVRPRTFELVRYRDPSGVSGTGVVAEGCVFSDGSVALRWCGSNPATAVWPDIDSVLAVHGHQGATEVRWIEQQQPKSSLFEDLHQVRAEQSLSPPHRPGQATSIADPLPGSHARGWAGARHLR
ncbi:hypothetical protein AB0H36_13220 [Kribbella sp. NPDC050820]|uniref:hypothetical protein n=1 Tax=Kribbella sp. NPDC050820 TaxID=3155408 RepID=UPI0033D264A1